MREDLINKVIDLQDKCNRMIWNYGQCDNETADELERLTDSLTREEGDEVLRRVGW